MAEYIDRNLIEWYGCDFEDGSCEHRECSECSQAECSHTQVMQIPPANVIPIPEGATNGDMIKAMFPNCEQKEHMNNGYFEMYFDNDLRNASYMRVSKDWWNAPYQKGAEME